MKEHSTSWQSVRAGNSDMRLFVVRPEATSKPAPGVIILQEAFGVNAHIRDVAVRIASLGYVAVAPDLFHRTGPGFEGDYEDLGKSMPHMEVLKPERLEEDLRAAHEWLSSDKDTDSGRIAAVGFCLGGKTAFIANALFPLKAAVSYYGSGIPAILQNYVDRQQAPILLFWGGEDKHIDAVKRAAIAEALRNRNKVFTDVEFSNAGHGFFCNTRKSYQANAAEESWALLAVFLKHHLSMQ